MKNIQFMLWILCSLCFLAACTDDDNGTEITSEVFIPHIGEIAAGTAVFGNSLTGKAEFYLQDAEGAKIQMTDVKYELPKITFTIPLTVDEGDYSLILKQENVEKNLGDIKVIMKMVEVKRLVSITGGMIDAEMDYDEYNRLNMFKMEGYKAVKIDYQGDNQIVVSLNDYRGDLTFTYQVENGRVVSSDEGEVHYIWNYDKDGYLQDLSVNGEPTYTYQYERGNLISTSDMRDNGGIDGFVYENSEWKNETPKVDVTTCAAYLSGIMFDDSQFLVSLLGLSGKTSANIPSGISAMGMNGAFSYEPDADGWAYKVSEFDLLGVGLSFNYKTVKVPEYLLK